MIIGYLTGSCVLSFSPIVCVPSASARASVSCVGCETITGVSDLISFPVHRVTASDLSALCSVVRAHDTRHGGRDTTHETMTSQTTRDTLPFSTGLHEHWFPVPDASAAPYEERLHAAPEGTAAHDERPAQQARLPDRLVVQRQRKSFRELRHRHVHRPAWSAGAAVRRR